MKTKHDKASLAIVKYYDTSTMDGLREQLLDMMQEMSMLNGEVMQSITEGFSDLHKKNMKRAKEEYLLNSGDLSYLEKQEEIQNALKDLAKKLYSPNCIKNKELLEKFKEYWGEAIYINLEIGYDVKEHAKQKFILNPCDTIQYQRLTCSDLLENFKFIVKVPLDESQYFPVKEDLYKILIRTMDKQPQTRNEFKNSYQYEFFSAVNKYPVTFIILAIFVSLLVGITVGCAVECATNEHSTGLCI